jgi:serine/threonine protein kinase
LVPDASAQWLAGKFFYMIEDANYLEVCQPVDELHPSYVKFLSGLEAIMRAGMMTPANVGIATPVTPSVSVTSDCVAFPYQVLCDATNNFDPTSQIGTGASGTVFKARIAHNGSEHKVAIKRLSYDGFSSELNELNEAFRQEIWRVSTVRHKNIVSVLGYSVQDNSPLLMVTPLHLSLFKCLYEGENLWLNWQARLKIAVGVAEGLAYLHDGAPERLVHCDIKPGNILLDANTLQAYIADFGTAKFMQRSETMVETLTVRGTLGFMDPHFLQYRRRSTKMDVYSFGVLLLVLVSGKEDARALVQKAKKEIFVDIQFGHRHDGTYKAWEVSRVLEIAKQCMRDLPSDRPSMSQVVMMLRGDIPCSIRPSLSSFVVSSIDFVQIASTSTFHKLRHSSILGAAVLIAAILMIVVMWKTSV